MRKMVIAGMLAALFVMSTTLAQAAFVLNFEGVGDFAPIGNFYNGGAGTNYGVDFSSNALGIIDADAGGGGNFGGEPSPSTVMFFLTGAASTMTVAAGFDTGFSFFYSAVNNPGSINVYDGLNGTGTVLASLNLPVTTSDGGDPNGAFSPFFAIGVSFSGIAKSIDFGGTADQIAFDDVTFGSATPGTGQVPEPSTLFLLGSGLVGLVGIGRRKFRQ